MNTTQYETKCDLREQLSAIDIQLKNADRVFRLYIKSLGERAVERVEESLKVGSTLRDALHNIRSPHNVDIHD